MFASSAATTTSSNSNNYNYSNSKKELDDWSGKKTVKAGQKARNAVARTNALKRSDPSFQGSEMALPPPNKPSSMMYNDSINIQSDAATITSSSSSHSCGKVSVAATESSHSSSLFSPSFTTDAISTLAINEGQREQKQKQQDTITNNQNRSSNVTVETNENSYDEYSMTRASYDDQETLDEEDSTVLGYEEGGCGAWSTANAVVLQTPEKEAMEYWNRVKKTRKQMRQRRKNNRRRAGKKAITKQKEQGMDMDEEDDDDYTQIEVVRTQQASKYEMPEEQPEAVDEILEYGGNAETIKDQQDAPEEKKRPKIISRKKLVAKLHKRMAAMRSSRSIVTATEDNIGSPDMDEQEGLCNPPNLEENYDDTNKTTIPPVTLLQRSRKSVSKISKSIKSSIHRSGSEIDKQGQDEMHAFKTDEENNANDEVTADEQEIDYSDETPTTRMQCVMNTSKRSLSNVGRSLKAIHSPKEQDEEHDTEKKKGELANPPSLLLKKNASKALKKAGKIIRSQSLSRLQTSINKLPESIALLNTKTPFKTDDEVFSRTGDFSFSSSVNPGVNGQDKYYVPPSGEEKGDGPTHVQPSDGRKGALEIGRGALKEGMRRIGKLGQNKDHNAESTHENGCSWVSADHVYLTVDDVLDASNVVSQM